MAAVLCAVALASVAASLDASLSTPVASDPGGSTAGGTSLLALLLALLQALLSTFGVTFEMTGGGVGGSSVLRTLLALLGAAYRHRIALVGAGALLTLGALASRRGGGIDAPIGRRRVSGPPSDEKGDRSAPEWPRGAPDDVVERAWVDLVERTDATDPDARTPAEVHRSAVEAGLDPDAVETLTESFRATRYGGDSLDEAQRTTVRQARRALADDSGGELG